MNEKITIWWILKQFVMEILAFFPYKINKIIRNSKGVYAYSPIGFNGLRNPGEDERSGIGKSESGDLSAYQHLELSESELAKRRMGRGNEDFL